MLYVATALTSELSVKPILDSRESTFFVTSDEYITNARKHKTQIATENGRSSFTKLAGKYKLTNTTKKILVSALTAPDFSQNLISIGQLAQK